ncbi:MAG: LLM class flavin-dependent oxidoreductase, partial [Chloroflexota bacterium]
MSNEGTSTQRPLRFGIVAGQHNRQWSEIREQFEWADESGFDSAWAFDHFMSLQKDDETGPCLEGYTLLSALAMVTENVKLGLMVTGITHRYPAVLFKEVTTVDHVSNGRAILGLGAAWQEREHEMYGMRFPPPRDRVDMVGEALEMFRLLESQDRTTFSGKHYTLDNAAFEPKPVQGHIPIMIGSTGKRMMRHIARYADMWDGGGSPDEYAALINRMNQLCEEIGRDPSEIEIALQRGGDAIASEDAFREHVKSYATVGVTTFLVSIPTGSPNATLRRIADEVIPELRD